MYDFNKVKMLNKSNYIKFELNDNKNKCIHFNKMILFEYITKLLLNPENLLYYASQGAFTMTLLETRKYINQLKKNKFLDDKIADIFKNLGWNSDILDINNTVFHGDLGEFLMSILIDKLNISNTIISKISLKTSSKVSSFGNDNIYYDIDGKILYYGESKFYDKTSDGLRDALDSVLKHKSEISEISYIRTHTNNIISKDKSTRSGIVSTLEFATEADFLFSSIIFVIEADNFETNNIESIIENLLKKEKYKEIIDDKMIILILPIISKKEFLEYFKGEITSGQRNN